ncbi:1415_t:CDS:2, partial [Racocetra persica]
SQDQDDQPAQQTQAHDLFREIAEAFREVAVHNVLPINPADANNWTLARKIKFILGHLIGIAASWYNNYKDDFLLWNDEINPENSFVQAFISYFATLK